MILATTLYTSCLEQVTCVWDTVKYINGKWHLDYFPKPIK